MELRFLRDIDGREIDFVLLQNGKPKLAVECKSGERGSSPWATYFRKRTQIPEFYQVHRGSRDSGDASKDVRILPLSTLCSEVLPLKLP